MLDLVQNLFTFASRSIESLWTLHADGDIRNTIPAPVAQLDRASDYGSEGLGFESLRVYKAAAKRLFCFHVTWNAPR